jgi:hypothetical protein
MIITRKYVEQRNAEYDALLAKMDYGHLRGKR